ncbi:hypothetical protein GCM10010911_55230 [Paenibacillus nasutitermitis]|uniref:Calcineurin-like phosphoesterase domain-containing protein n=2 Tax=Paenibacillus nasutitermitis TaxID=1652958 RepID=A0A916ZDB5_9BACL|nr:hypothetical protein GCM10010911_55230 [Paenibacillus nasutitermitis]
MRLVLMGDLHYHEIDAAIPGLAEARSVFYNTLLERFLDVEGDLHVSIGDLTNFGTSVELQEVYELLRRDERTFIHVLGNHDLYSQTREQVLAITGQRRYFAMDTESALLVFLDTAREMDLTDWGGWLDEEQLQWLEQMVEASGTKPLLVFGHHPVYKTTRRSEGEKSSIHPDIDMRRILNRKQGVGVYFNGHTHVDSIIVEGSWTFVQLSSCMDQHAFRIVELADQDIRISTMDIADAAVHDHAPILHQHMKHFRPTLEARGTDADREHVISLLAGSQTL